jgi:hypothetical protein
MSATEHKRVFRRLIEEGFNGGRRHDLDSRHRSRHAREGGRLEQRGITVT